MSCRSRSVLVPQAEIEAMDTVCRATVYLREQWRPDWSAAEAAANLQARSILMYVWRQFIENYSDLLGAKAGVL